MSASSNLAHIDRSKYGGFDYKSAMEKLFLADGGVTQKAAFQSGDAGRSNDVFGAVMWNQVNAAAPAYGMLPKVDATGAGPNSIDDPRPQTFRAAYNPPSMSTPAEGGSYSTSVDFDTAEVKADPHHSQLKFEATIIQQIESRLQDDVPLDEIEGLMDQYFREEYEVSGILRGVNSSTNGGTQYSNDNAIVSLDRVIASQDEEANADGIGGTALEGGDLDVYGIDRSNVTWADSVVEHNSGGGDRQLTEDLIDSTVASLVNNGANLEDLVILTGSDTARVMDELRESRVRFEAGTSMETEDVNGEESRGGMSAVTRFRDWDGIPIVEAHNTPSDSLSRIYILDVSPMENPTDPGTTVPKIGVETYFGPIVERAGPGRSTNTLAIDNLADEVGFLHTHEVVCRRFSHQAKIRDLKE
jgi:hypothetical protein